MTTEFTLGEITVEVVLKNIKNIRLSVLAPAGRARVAAPRRVKMGTLRDFVVSKLGWIRKQQVKMKERLGETPCDDGDGESQYVWGERYALRVFERNKVPSVALTQEELVLGVRWGTDEKKRRALLEAWYRDEVKRALPALVAKWEPVMGVKVDVTSVWKMKSRWGSCSPRKRSIRLNSDLARKPPACLEYVVVHEMVHLLEPSHNARFYALMDGFLPGWKAVRQQLNSLPIRR